MIKEAIEAWRIALRCKPRFAFQVGHVFQLGATVCTGIVVCLCLGGAVSAEQLFQLRNGLAIRGTKVELPTLRDGFAAAAAGDSHLRPVWLIDDGLRRHYVHGRTMVVGDPVDVAAPGVAIEFPQPRPTGGSAVGTLGSILHRSGFNEFGRRRLTIRGPTGAPIEVIQGITQINPRYAKLETLKNDPSLLWDMRVATSSIDSATLDRIFSRSVATDDLDARLELVRFYTDAERYGDAHRALSDVIADFPDTDDLKPLLVSLVGRGAEQLLEEAVRRIEVGQRDLGRQILQRFPQQGIGRVMRLRVQNELQRLQADQSKVQQLLTQLENQSKQLDGPAAENLEPAIDEIRQHLSPRTLDRLADYQRLGLSEEIPLENRVSLAIAGWVLGGGSGLQNLAVAKSAFRVRVLTSEYLAAADANRRSEILAKIRAEEAGNTETIDKLAAQLRPSHPFDAAAIDTEVEGLFHVDVPGVDALPLDRLASILADAPEVGGVIDAIDYHLQLPPEYDPNVSYPVVVALPSSRSPAISQIEWWCGPATQVAASSRTAMRQPKTSDADKPAFRLASAIGDQEATEAAAESATEDSVPRVRLGHAARNGFVVLSIRWSRPGQRLYEYTGVEHHRVLASLRHAMRRVSIDADRVYLTGHGEGATAAWDMALTHPDVWAGLIAVSGKPSKTVLHYETNARRIPKYIVFGQLDPDAVDGSLLDTYMSARHDAMVVMYRGRGRDSFFDEVPRMFEWMRSSTNVRRPMPSEFEVATMRRDDRRFWWLELDQVNPEIVLDPIQWQGRIRAGTVEGSIGADNLIRFSGPADAFRLHLRPMANLDLSRSLRLRHGNRTVSQDFDGDIEIILNDLATRADRSRPTWMILHHP